VSAPELDVVVELDCAPAACATELNPVALAARDAAAAQPNRPMNLRRLAPFEFNSAELCSGPEITLSDAMSGLLELFVGVSNGWGQPGWVHATFIRELRQDRRGTVLVQGVAAFWY
jgi:hypothetical protein